MPRHSSALKCLLPVLAAGVLVFGARRVESAESGRASTAGKDRKSSPTPKRPVIRATAAPKPKAAAPAPRPVVAAAPVSTEDTARKILGPSESWGQVNASRVNIRSGPSMDQSVVGTLRSGEFIRARAAQNGWLEIEWPASVPTWIEKNDVQTADGVVGSVRDASASVRGSGHPQSPSLTTLQRGARVQIVGESGAWYKIKAPAGAVAYISSRYVITGVGEPARPGVEPPAQIASSAPSRQLSRSPLPAPGAVRETAKAPAPVSERIPIPAPKLPERAPEAVVENLAAAIEETRRQLQATAAAKTALINESAQRLEQQRRADSIRTRQAEQEETARRQSEERAARQIAAVQDMVRQHEALEEARAAQEETQRARWFNAELERDREPVDFSAVPDPQMVEALDASAAHAIQDFEREQRQRVERVAFRDDEQPVFFHPETAAKPAVEELPNADTTAAFVREERGEWPRPSESSSIAAVEPASPAPAIPPAQQETAAPQTGVANVTERDSLAAAATRAADLARKAEETRRAETTRLEELARQIETARKAETARVADLARKQQEQEEQARREHLAAELRAREVAARKMAAQQAAEAEAQETARRVELALADEMEIERLLDDADQELAVIEWVRRAPRETERRAPAVPAMPLPAMIAVDSPAGSFTFYDPAQAPKTVATVRTAVEPAPEKQFSALVADAAAKAQLKTETARVALPSPAVSAAPVRNALPDPARIAVRAPVVIDESPLVAPQEPAKPKVEFRDELPLADSSELPPDAVAYRATASRVRKKFIVPDREPARPGRRAEVIALDEGPRAPAISIAEAAIPLSTPKSVHAPVVTDESPLASAPAAMEPLAPPVAEVASAPAPEVVPVLGAEPVETALPVSAARAYAPEFGSIVPSEPASPVFEAPAKPVRNRLPEPGRMAPSRGLPTPSAPAPKAFRLEESFASQVRASGATLRALSGKLEPAARHPVQGVEFALTCGARTYYLLPGGIRPDLAALSGRTVTVIATSIAGQSDVLEACQVVVGNE